MRTIAVSLLIVLDLGIAVVPAAAQETPPVEEHGGADALGDPTATLDTEARPKINTDNKGGPPTAAGADNSVGNTEPAAATEEYGDSDAGALPDTASSLPLLAAFGLLALAAAILVRLLHAARASKH